MKQPFEKKNLFKTKVTFIVIAFYLYSEICIGQIKPLMLRIDPSQAHGATVKDIIDSIIYIPLATSKESLFGKVTQLEVTNDYFIILDRETKCILFFKHDGSFDHKIKLKGQTSKFIINKKKKELTYAVITKERSDRFSYRYSFEGLQLMKTVVAQEIEAQKRYEYLYDTYIFANQDMVVAKGFPLKKDHEDSTRAKAWLTFHHEYGNATAFATGLEFKADLQFDVGTWTANNGPFYNSGADDFVLFAKAYDYNIYKVRASGRVDTLYKLILPLKNATPVDFTTNPQYNEKRMGYFQENKDKVYFLENCYQFGDRLFFKLNCINTDDQKNYDDIYNLKNGELTSYLRVASDSKSFHLPLFSDNFAGFIAFDGEFLYRSVSSVEMFGNYEANKEKKLKYPANVKKYFDKGTSKDNPVLVLVKFRNN
ncbi:hypothetical protein ACVWYN_000418 [Pedobacter sp. UYP24]